MKFFAISRLICVTAWLTLSVRSAEQHSSLVIVIDGLRPDYITREIMPHLFALGEAGVIAEAHHSVFPTVTRVNSSSLATGAYPREHGLMYNSLYLPEVSPKAIDTADAPALLAVEASTAGRLLTAPSVGELFTRADKKVLAIGSGSTGSTLLLNHKANSAGAALGVSHFSRPADLARRAEALLGPGPTTASSKQDAMRWAVDAYLEFGLKELRPDATYLWLTDPDGTAHRHGVGAPEVLAALRGADSQLGRLLDTLMQRGLRERVNIFVTADHGFSTHGGPANIPALLTSRGLAGGVKIVGPQLYVESGGDEKIRRIVALLQETPWVGAIFTRAAEPGGSDGFVPGTLSLAAVHLQHARAADIMVDPLWADAKNAHGYRGTTTAGGVAGHGSSSPYDIHIRLIAAGPALKQGLRSSVPTGNIDLAVTLCHLHGMKPAPSMAGRVLTELLREGPPAESVRVERTVHRVATETAIGPYRIELHRSRVGATEYIDYTKTSR
jgi:arylsulfatase A-like enzyme